MEKNGSSFDNKEKKMGNAKDDHEFAIVEANGCLGNILEGIVAIFLFAGFLVIISPVVEFLGLSHQVETLAENHFIIFLICAYIVYFATVLIIGFAIYCLIKLVAFIFRKLGIIVDYD